MSTEVSLQFTQWALEFFMKQWSWNLVAIGVGFFFIIMTRRILLISAKSVLVTGAAIIALSAISGATPSGEIVFTTLINIVEKVGMPDGLTGGAWAVVGGVFGEVFKRAPPIPTK